MCVMIGDYWLEEVGDTLLVWEVLLSICCFYQLMNKTVFSQCLNKAKPNKKV